MNDYRAAGQELQGQVMAAARKGQERVHSTVKTMRAAADQIRPQLASLPKPPTPGQLRERAPQLVAKLPARLQTRLPKPEQLRSGAEELVGHARSVRRVVIGQVASVAAPLAQQAADRLAQISEPVNGKASTPSKSGTTAKSSTASKRSTARKPRSTAKSTASTGASAAGTTTKVSKVTVTSDSKPQGTTGSASSAKPKAKPADK